MRHPAFQLARLLEAVGFSENEGGAGPLPLCAAQARRYKHRRPYRLLGTGGVSSGGDAPMCCFIKSLIRFDRSTRTHRPSKSAITCRLGTLTPPFGPLRSSALAAAASTRQSAEPVGASRTSCAKRLHWSSLLIAAASKARGCPPRLLRGSFASTSSKVRNASGVSNHRRASC